MTKAEQKKIRTIMVKHTSEMLDNPNKHDIYPTTKFYNNLEADIKALIDEAVLEARIDELTTQAHHASYIKNLGWYVDRDYITDRIKSLERQK